MRLSLVALAACGAFALGGAQSIGEPADRIVLGLHRSSADTVHSEIYQRRRLLSLALDESPSESVPLNPGLGTHYTWVYAGTPPQRASVITDTGSSIMAFPCSGCNGCGKHTDQPYAAAKSSTMSHVTCDVPTFFRCKGCREDNMCSISQSYMEGSSWRAAVVEDRVYLGGNDSANDEALRDHFSTRFMFGCQSSETGLFISQVADGIMGLANNDNHIVAKLHRENRIRKKQFALCFAPEGGSMTVGEPDVSRHLDEPSYAKLIQQHLHDFYAVQFRDVRIGEVSIQADPSIYNRGHFIVDSGTTDSYLPRALRPSFERAFEQATGMKYRTSSASCKGFTDPEFERLPNITFALEGVDGNDMLLKITPSQYLLEEKDKRYCANIFLSESSGGVIGANIMMDRDVIFDMENQRVGFAHADCSYRQLSGTSPSSRPPNQTVTVDMEHEENSTTSNEANSSPSSSSPTLPGNTSSSAPSLTSPTPVLDSNSSATKTSKAPQTPSSAPSDPTPVPVPSHSNQESSGDEIESEPPHSKNNGSLIDGDTSQDGSSESETSSSPKLGSSSGDGSVHIEGNLTSSSSASQSNDLSSAPLPSPTEKSTESPSSSQSPSPTPSVSSGESEPSTRPPSYASTGGSHSNGATENTAGTHSGAALSDSTGEEHPMVLTIVGAVLVVAFLAGSVFACRRHRFRKQKWSRVNETEEEEEELGVSAPSDSNSIGLRNPVNRVDQLDSDGEEDEDEIFDRTVQDRDDFKHDTRVLEQL